VDADIADEELAVLRGNVVTSLNQASFSTSTPVLDVAPPDELRALRGNCVIDLNQASSSSSSSTFEVDSDAPGKLRSLRGTSSTGNLVISLNQSSSESPSP
jgi:hypothetical protein